MLSKTADFTTFPLWSEFLNLPFVRPLSQEKLAVGGVSVLKCCSQIAGKRLTYSALTWQGGEKRKPSNPYRLKRTKRPKS